MKTVKRRSQKQEREVAKSFNAKTVVASGALWGAKGDCKSDKCLIECKTTEKEYYSVTSKVWEKIEDEAIKDHGRIPLLVVDVQDKDRLVVFNPKYFSKPVPTPFENSSNGDNQKSFRVSLTLLIEIGMDIEEYCYGKLFTICGKKKNMLVYMRADDFYSTYREEL